MPHGRYRRGNGQGTAIKRGRTWTAVWTEPAWIDEDGKRHTPRRWKGGFRTKNEALIYASNPHPISSEAPTLRSYYETWKASDYLDLSKNKQSAYRTAWNKLSPIANRRMDTLTIADLQSTVDAKADTHYPAKDMRQLLSHLFKRAVAEGHARTNLADFIRIPPLEEAEADPFTEKEIKALWSAYPKEPFIGYLLLMIYTGMMPGELFRLDASMIHYDTREIIGCGLKTKKRRQTPIVFPELLVPVLMSIAADPGKVVRMNKDNWYKAYHDTLRRVGVRDLPPYSCRHTTATALALGNIAPSVIQEVMRHTKFQTTQRYIHPDTEAAKSAIDTLK